MECIFPSEVGCDAPEYVLSGHQPEEPHFLSTTLEPRHFSWVNKGWPLMTLSPGQSRERLE